MLHLANKFLSETNESRVESVECRWLLIIRGHKRASHLLATLKRVKYSDVKRYSTAALILLTAPSESLISDNKRRYKLFSVVLVLNCSSSLEEM
ncbi:hypothetical protein TNCT_4011 [Trichonephila clavata]|uniref:Uncharacterized protein n=1 Tax=Trichonephila clavata TaxID=2740835 RepID=A0A8X6H4Z3_TRICU|nr:hypothetical protein TNCT_4011 [Trichonephila clavata]